MPPPQNTPHELETRRIAIKTKDGRTFIDSWGYEGGLVIHFRGARGPRNSTGSASLLRMPPYATTSSEAVMKIDEQFIPQIFDGVSPRKVVKIQACPSGIPSREFQ